MHRLQRVSRVTRLGRITNLRKKSLWNRIQPEYKLLIGYILFLLFILMFVSVTGCDSGWTIAGWEVK